MQVITEDGYPLDADAAEQGLALRLAPAGKGRAEEVTVAMEPGAIPSHLQLNSREGLHYHRVV